MKKNFKRVQIARLRYDRSGIIVGHDKTLSPLGGRPGGGK